MKHRLSSALHKLNPFNGESPLQVLAASITFWFGLWLLLPASSFAATPAWAIIATLMPEDALGGALLLLGLCQLAALLLTSKRMAVGVAIFSVLVWSAISYSFWLSSPASTGAVIYPHVALLNTIIVVRLSAQ